MYLVDTSVWIDYLKEKENAAVNQFMKLLDDKTPFAITSVIYQEILQGASAQQDFHSLVEYLSTIRFVYPIDPVLSYQAAAKLYFDCRKAGITLRSTIDCLIVQIAIENKLILLHNDKDFSRIQKITPSLVILSKEHN